jgi:hypothetical protein
MAGHRLLYKHMRHRLLGCKLNHVVVVSKRIAKLLLLRMRVPHHHLLWDLLRRADHLLMLLERIHLLKVGLLLLHLRLDQVLRLLRTLVLYVQRLLWRGSSSNG